MGLRDYLRGERVQKSLEPTKCALCNGNHKQLEVMMTCGDCHDGLFNFMGGNDEFAALFGPRNSITKETPHTEEVTAGAAKTRGSAARAEGLKTGGLDSPPASPTAESFKEPVRSAKKWPTDEEPATHTSTNSSKARS